MYTITNVILLLLCSKHVWNNLCFKSYVDCEKEWGKSKYLLPRSHDHIKARASSLVLLRKRIKRILIKPNTWLLNANTLHNQWKSLSWMITRREVNISINISHWFWVMNSEGYRFLNAWHEAFTSAHVIQQGLVSWPKWNTSCALAVLRTGRRVRVSAKSR